MDNGLVPETGTRVINLATCLNPYCSGQWSRTVEFTDDYDDEIKCLNPYCSGQWSRTARTVVMNTTDELVLILIVVDNGLVQLQQCCRL